MDLDGNREIPEVPGTISADRLASESYKHVSIISDMLTEGMYRKYGSGRHSDGPGQSKIISINISGLVFETRAETFSRFPNTLLGDPKRRAPFFDPVRGQYFFDRHRLSFEAILFYYQSNGRIQRPVTVPLNVFIDEIRFFQLGEPAMRYLRHDEGLMSSDDIQLPENKFKRKLWLILEHPLSSKYAKWLSILSMLMILISVASFCIETLPVFITYTVDMTNAIPVIKDDSKFFDDHFFAVEVITMIYFTAELLLRFFCCPSKVEFLKSGLNILDALSVLPFYIFIGILLFNPDNLGGIFYIRSFTFLRLIRVVRVLKLSRHSKGLQVLGKTIFSSSRELILLFFCLIVCVVIFATMVYYAELDNKSTGFSSIPDSFWWAVVTMTTVGYGDMHPETTLGKFVGCICAIAGVLTIALPVPVIVSNFNYFYTKERENEELIKHSVKQRLRALYNEQPLTSHQNIETIDEIQTLPKENEPKRRPLSKSIINMLPRALDRFRRTHREQVTLHQVRFRP